MNTPLAVVLAAGKGTRMESDLPKVLCEVLGRPMIEYVLDALRQSGVGRILVVVGYRSDLVRDVLGGRPGVEFVEQTEQLGTGHAVMVCREQLAGHDGAVAVVTGDSPMLQTSSLTALLAEYAASRPACIIGTTHAPDPTGLGRIVRDPEGEFQAIVEEKDATTDQKAIDEVNMSTYVFDCRDLLWSFDALTTDNAQQEYYITDCPGILQAAGKRVLALDVLQPCEALSINNREQLRAVEAAMEKMQNG